MADKQVKTVHPEAATPNVSERVGVKNVKRAVGKASSGQVLKIDSGLLEELLKEVKGLRAEINMQMKDGTVETRRSWIIAFLSLLVAIIFGLIGLWVSMDRRVDNVERKVEASRFVIDSPSESDGDGVGLGQIVRGKTPFIGMNHYIIVTPVGGTSYVQDKPAFVNRDEGTFSGEAKFGSVSVGEDGEFKIQALATKSTLQPGPLTFEPQDAEKSQAVIVRRNRE
jgi:hypothetical protein